MRVRLLVVATQLLAFAIGCQAAGNIGYSVNLSFGSDATATGDIITDGTLGTLSASDIVDWNLLLSETSSSTFLLGPLSGNNSTVGVSGSDVTATPSQINFNFSESDSGYFFFETSGSPISFLCFGPGAGVCAVDHGGNGIGDELNGGGLEYTALTGVQQIASNPEPSTVWLGGGALGAFLLVGVIRRLRIPVA